MGDAVVAAMANQKLPGGYYHLDRMLGSCARHGADIGCCGTCVDARGTTEDMLSKGTRRSTLDELADWSVWAEHSRTRRQQRGDNLPDVIRLPEPAERGLGDDRRDDLRVVLERVVGDPRAGRTRGDRVDPDTARAELLRHAPGQDGQPMWGARTGTGHLTCADTQSAARQG